jgi:hypothetical protein
MGSLANPATPTAQFFDSAVPLEPTALRQGDSWNWERAFPDYPSALYSLTYVLDSASARFVLAGTGTGAPISADEDQQTFDIQAPSSLTAGCTPGAYKLLAVLAGIAGTTAAGQQVTIPLQDVEVYPNLATATGPVDVRSIAKKNLDAINVCLLNNTDPGVQEYTINGRQLRRFNRADLLKEREYWKNEYKAELRASGQYTSPRSIGFRFTTQV